MHTRLFLLGVLYAILSHAQDTRKCYWPNGQELNKTADRYHFTPCFDGDSQCCASGEVCMTNGLCFGGDIGEVYRGACTDKDWKTTACPQYCNTIFDTGWANLVPCPLNSNGQWRWWCGAWQDTALCSEGANSSFLDYPKGRIAKIVLFNASDANSSTTNPAANCSLASGLPADQDGCSGAQCKKDDGGASPLAVGLGLGIPLFLLAASLAALLFRERKKNKRYTSINQGGQTTEWGQNGGGMQQYAPNQHQQGGHPVELHGNDQPVELDPTKSPAEVRS